MIVPFLPNGLSRDVYSTGPMCIQCIHAVKNQIYPHLQTSRTYETFLLEIITRLAQKMADGFEFPDENEITKHAIRFSESATSDRLVLNPAHFFASGEDALRLTAMLEYMVAEMVELSGHVTMDNQKKRLAPMSLYIAVHRDAELRMIVDKMVVLQDVYVPTVTELKSLGGKAWADYFLHGTDPYAIQRDTKTWSDIYDRYKQWYECR